MNMTLSPLDKLSGVVNRIFKLAILIFIAIFLFLYYRSTESKRYQYYKVDFSDCNNIIFDSKTGEIFGLMNDDKGKPTAN